MKFKYMVIFISFLLFFSINASASFEINSPTAVLIDADTGFVLYDKNSDQKMYPASTTKIMTAILAIEKGNMDDTVTASFYAVNSIEYDSTKLGLYEGETISFKDLFMSLVVCSANDAANVVAEHISGSVDEFVKLMNKRAVELGAINTHFVNPSGLHSEEHISTAKDLAVLARYAMTLPQFREAVSTRQYKINPTNKYNEIRILNSTNHLTNPHSVYYYEYATGIKTGYTTKSKSCLVSSASKNGSNLIVVVLGGENIDGKSSAFVDSKNLFEYGFNNFKPQTIINKGDIISSLPIKNAKGTKEIILEAADTKCIILPEGVSVSDLKKKEYIREVIKAPIAKGEMMGKMEYWYNDLKLCETEMLAITSYSKQPFIFILNILKSVWFYIIAFVLLILRFKPKKRRRRKSNYRKKSY